LIRRLFRSLSMKIKGLSTAVHVLVWVVLLVMPYISTDQSLITQPMAVNSSEFSIPI
jgi:hypothetical protein